MSVVPPQPVVIPVDFGGDQLVLNVPGKQAPISASVIPGVPATVTVNLIGGGGGSTTITQTVPSKPVVPDDPVVLFGEPGKVGTAKGLATTPTGQRVSTVEVPGWGFEAGTGPFFSQVLPDGTVAMPAIWLTGSQVNASGLSMSMGFWSPKTSEFYVVRVPTTTGYTEVYSVNSITGAQGTDGGADLSDCTVTTVSGQPVLFGTSALTYRGWNTATYGEYPVLPAFTLDATTGRWAYNASLSIFPAQLRASDPTNGTTVWPNTTNFFGQTVTTTTMPVEITTLPKSGHLALSIYAPPTGQNTGGVVVVDPAAKVQKAAWLPGNFQTVSGATFRVFARDVNADPTSSLGDERILVNFDTFKQPNEQWNITINASSGTWRVSWGGTYTSPMAVGVDALTVQGALEGIPGIGAGNVRVSMVRPFLVSTYTTYMVEMVGALVRTDLSGTATALDTSSLTGDSGSSVSRWKTGSTSYTDHAPFPLVELSYNNGAATLTPTCPPFVPQQAVESTSYPESVDASFGLGWYDALGNVWAVAKGESLNPANMTAFNTLGIHGWRNNGGVRGYQATPTTGWQSRIGEHRPAPDVMTDPVHGGNFFALALCDDPASGGVVAAGATGRLKVVPTTPGLVNRTGNILPTTITALSSWSVNSPHTRVWSDVDGALKVTAGSSADMVVSTAQGASGVPSPAWLEGQVVNWDFDVFPQTAVRAVQPFVKFYDSNGTEVGTLSGWGPATLKPPTGAWKRIVGAAKIPVGCRYVAVGATIAAPATGNVFLLRNPKLYAAAFTPAADVDLGASNLWVGALGSAGVAKGFVDPVNRHLWLPYYTNMSRTSALNTKRPSWLARVDMARVFPARTTGELT